MNPLTIRALELVPVLVPLANPIRTASLTISHAPLLLIDLHTEIGGEEGPSGRAYLFTYTPVALKPTMQLLLELQALLRGQPCAPVTLYNALRGQFRHLGTKGLIAMALAGIDMAAWDACARHAGMPLVRLLGAAPRALPAYSSQGMDGHERAVEQAGQALEQGFRAMKIKIGYPTLGEDLAVVKAVLATLGSHAQLMVDYNQSLSFDEALRRCHALDGLGLGWIEEPTAQDDYAGHARLARELSTPVQLGESWYGVGEMAQSLANASSDLVMPDVTKIGGVTGWQQAAALAAAGCLSMSSHLLPEISAHLLCATPTAHWLLYIGLADPILQHPLRVVDGAVTPNESPGSGIDWDADAVARFRVE